MARRCVLALAVLSAGSMLGAASSLYLVNHHPLLLIGLSPLGRHLVLVAPTVDPLPFLLVSVARRMLFFLASFHLGRALGPAAIAWIERRAAYAGRFVRFIERIFNRAPRTVVLLLPGPTVSVLAGVSGQGTRLFVALTTAGLALRMLAIFSFAEWLRAPIEALLQLIDTYWLPGTVAIVAALALHRVWQWRQRLNGEAPSSPPGQSTQ
jgi:hypothetical protein